jgi:methionyl-tRNA formyltransferase
VRVVFLGTPAAAVPSLEAILDAGHEVPLVVTRPDRPVGRSATPEPPPVKVRARAAGLTVLQPTKVRDAAFRAAIVAARPDVLAVVAYGRILPATVLAAAPHGAVNVHFSLLPKLRGAAPVAWALVRGETETGVTTFRLDEGLDTGEVLLARRVAIEEHEHAPALLARLAAIGGALLVETLDGLGSGSITPRAQDHALATAAPRLAREDGAWDPDWTAREVEGRVRGLDPWPGVWAATGGRRIRLIEALATERSTALAPGSVMELDGDRLLVAAVGGGVVAVVSVQPDGRRAMSAREAVSGRQLTPGSRLERPPA